MLYCYHSTTWCARPGVDGRLIGRADNEPGMRYVLIPVTYTAANLGDVIGVPGPAALARILERVVLTSELLVTYAVALAGKPSTQ